MQVEYNSKAAKETCSSDAKSYSLEHVVAANHNSPLIASLMLLFIDGQIRPIDATPLLLISNVVKWPVPAASWNDIVLKLITLAINQ